MRKKSDAQIYLEQAEMIDSIVANKLIEQQQWRDIALGITANMDGERVHSSGGKSKMASAIDKCVDMEAEIDRLIDKLVDTKRDITSTIEKLDSPYEYRLLHLRYIQYVELADIAERWGKDYTTITTAHGRAVAHVKKILDGRRK